MSKIFIVLIIFIVFNNYLCNSINNNNNNYNNNYNNNNNNNLKKRNLFYFTDANIDDIITLQSVLSNEEFILRGICVSGTGFTTNQIGSDTILKALTILAEKDFERFQSILDIPVALGSSIPIDSPLNLDISILNATNNQVRIPAETLWNTKTEYFTPSNNNTNLLPTNQSCTQLFLEINENLLELNQSIEILSTGPATDLALLLIEYPNAIDNIELVSQMGGTIDAPANIFTYRNNTVAEFNLYVDVKAFQIVLSSFGTKLLLTPLDATDTNPITKEFFYDHINEPSTYSGKWLQSLFTNIKNILTDPLFFNDAHIKGKGFYTWDFESYRVLFNRNCDKEIIDSISINDTNSPNNPNGKITLSSSSNIKTRICTYIDSNSSHSLLSEIYKYQLP